MVTRLRAHKQDDTMNSVGPHLSGLSNTHLAYHALLRKSRVESGTNLTANLYAQKGVVVGIFAPSDILIDQAKGVLNHDNYIVTLLMGGVLSSEVYLKCNLYMQ